MKWDYHVHLEQGPYSREWLQRFLETARLAGIDEIGFSEHAYRFRQTEEIWPSSWSHTGEVDADDYVDLVQAAMDAGYPVKLGVEIDFVPGREKRLAEFIDQYPWDYVIGSVHYIDEWGLIVRIRPIFGSNKGLRRYTGSISFCLEKPPRLNYLILWLILM